MPPPHPCLKQWKVDESDLMTKLHIYLTEEDVWQKIKLDIFMKKVEMDKIINIETMKQEIEDNRLTRNRLKEEEENEIESNPYDMAILNKTSKDDTKIEQMINWSILSHLIKYNM